MKVLFQEHLVNFVHRVSQLLERGLLAELASFMLFFACLLSEDAIYLQLVLFGSEFRGQVRELPIQKVFFEFVELFVNKSALRFEISQVAIT